MSIADNPRSHAQVTPFYQVRTTQEPVYQAQGSPIVSLYHREGAAGAPARLRRRGQIWTNARIQGDQNQNQNW
jgi:hypothetical protein